MDANTNNLSDATAGRGRGRSRRRRARRKERKVQPVDLQAILDALYSKADVPPVNWNAQQIQNMFRRAKSLPLSYHQAALKCNRALYAAVLISLDSLGVELSSSTKVRILAATLSSTDTLDLGLHILKNCFSPSTRNGWQTITIAELAGALNMLDGRRKIRASVGTINKLAAQQTGVKSKAFKKSLKTLNKVKSMEIALVGSLSGSLVRLLKKKWCRGLSPGYLRDQAQMTAPTRWRELAGLLHFHPSDFQLPWFLDWIHDKGPTKSDISMSNQLKSKLAAGDKPTDLESLIEAKIPWALLRKAVKGGDLTRTQKLAITTYTSLDVVLWRHEDLACDEVDLLINKRLEAGELPQFGYGVLMERLVHFQSKKVRFLSRLINVAEERLEDVNVTLQSVLVAGDASYNMSVAIRTAAIISSLVSSVINRQAKVQSKSAASKSGAITGCLFRLFTHKPVPVLKAPTTVKEVLNFASTVTGNGTTAPAAALYQLLVARQKVEQLLYVTDEEEDRPYPAHDNPNHDNPTFFIDALREYKAKINPNVQLIIVSFAEKNCHSSMGKLEEAARNMLNMTPVVFTLNPRNPNLKKLDSLIGVLASQGAWFQQRVQSFYSRLQREWATPLLPDLLDDAQQRFVASSENREDLCKAVEALAPLKQQSPAVFKEKLDALLSEKGFVPPPPMPPTPPSGPKPNSAHVREQQRQQHMATVLQELDKHRGKASGAKVSHTATVDTPLLIGNEAMNELSNPVLQHILTYLSPVELASSACVCRKFQKQFTEPPILAALYGADSPLLCNKQDVHNVGWTTTQTFEEMDQFAQPQSHFSYW